MFAATTYMRPKHHHGWMPAVVCAAMTACIADVSDDEQSKQPLSPEEQDTVLQFVESHGFDTSEAYFDKGDFVLTGDARVEGSTLLDAAHATVQKGYWFRQGGSSEPVPTPGFPAWVVPYNLSFEWSFAVFLAAVDWSLNTPVEFFWGPPPAGEDNAIVAAYWPFDVFPLPGISNGTTALGWAETPVGGNVGTAVLFNTNYNAPLAECGGENAEVVPFEQKLSTAVHELGHALGFSHPSDGLHIEGTEPQTATNKYPSVMWPNAGLVCASTSATDRYVSALSADDIASAEAKFSP